MSRAHEFVRTPTCYTPIIFAFIKSNRSARSRGARMLVVISSLDGLINSVARVLKIMVVYLSP